jgi:YrbI family 3-deoxy-D-manno-octulosonate 8-phosphate phosphatase
VDGVLTDGRYLYDLNGKQYKQFGPHDADAVKFFREMDVEVYAISADKRGFAITLKRLEDMDVEIAYVSEETRLTYIQEKASKGRVAFVGDGYFDIPALKAACIGYAPNNALTVVKNNADVVLPVSGGEGVLLSVFEHFLSLYDQELFDKYSKGELKHG